jgi:hypothetical protein
MSQPQTHTIKIGDVDASDEQALGRFLRAGWRVVACYPAPVGFQSKRLQLVLERPIPETPKVCTHPPADHIERCYPGKHFGRLTCGQCGAVLGEGQPGPTPRPSWSDPLERPRPPVDWSVRHEPPVMDRTGEVGAGRGPCLCLGIGTCDRTWTECEHPPSERNQAGVEAHQVGCAGDKAGHPCTWPACACPAIGPKADKASEPPCPVCLETGAPCDKHGGKPTAKTLLQKVEEANARPVPDRPIQRHVPELDPDVHPHDVIERNKRERAATRTAAQLHCEYPTRHGCAFPDCDCPPLNEGEIPMCSRPHHYCGTFGQGPCNGWPRRGTTTADDMACAGQDGCSFPRCGCAQIGGRAA